MVRWVITVRVTERKCLVYKIVEEKPPIPVIPIKLTTPLKSNVMMTVFIDTGYDGALLLPLDLFTSLNIPQLDEEEFRIYETPGGELIRFPCGIAKVEIYNVLFPIVEVEATTHIQEVLIGRELLNSLNLALLGKEKKCCELLQNSE